MIITTLRTIAISACVCLVTACSGLLDVNDPTLIQDSDLANADGANAQRLSAVSSFNGLVSTPVQNGALFSDELMYDTQDPVFGGAPRYLDTHDTASFQSSYGNGSDEVAPLTRIFTRAAIALPGVRANADTAVRGDYIAQLYALRGYAIIQMAEDLCSGFPINDVRNGAPFYSQPYTPSGALAFAVATLDTALANVRDSSRFLNFARVLKARALTDLGQYERAKTAVVAVPTDFVYGAERGGTALANSSFPDAPQAVGNHDGGTGLPFASAGDPRVPSTFRQMRFHRTDDTVSDSLREQQKYTENSDIVVASGVEARLIEAEAALNDNDPVTWLAKLNDLRAQAITPALPPLADPGPATRLDTLFKERAFWLYLTGHRLGDMRRLVKNYLRPDTTVFAHGVHPMGIVYSNAKAIPFIFLLESQYNPNILFFCLSRNTIRTLDAVAA